MNPSTLQNSSLPLSKALEYRRRLGGDLEALPLIHGESDACQGCGRPYGDVLCVQLLTKDGRCAGVARRALRELWRSVRPQRQCLRRVGGAGRVGWNAPWRGAGTGSGDINGLRLPSIVLAGQKPGCFSTSAKLPAAPWAWCRERGPRSLLLCRGPGQCMRQFGANGYRRGCLGGGRASGRGNARRTALLTAAALFAADVFDFLRDHRG